MPVAWNAMGRRSRSRRKPSTCWSRSSCIATGRLSKDEILSLVWPDSIVEEANLAQQVLLLRRALGDAGDYVATIPRFGYRFTTDVVEEPSAPRRSRPALIASFGTGGNIPFAKASR